MQNANLFTSQCKCFVQFAYFSSVQTNDNDNKRLGRVYIEVGDPG